jgi:23S rRNA (uracil1939-C5)-methyltransferase
VKVRVGTECSLWIDNIAHDGRGVGSFEGKKVFVFGALKGEHVLVRVDRSASRYMEGRMLKVLDKLSSERVTPVCEAFGRCGGCTLQHWQRTSQLRHKQSVVAEWFARQQALLSEESWHPILTAYPLSYRAKARLGVRFVPKKGGILLGFREQHSNKLALLSRCEILAEPLGGQLEILKQCISDLSVAQHIAQVEVAMLEEQTVLVLRHMQALSVADKECLKRYAARYHWTIYLQAKGPDTVCGLEGEAVIDLKYHLVIDKRTVHYSLHPLDFFQINSVLNQKMVLQALEWLGVLDGWGQGKKMLECFSGVGNFTMALGLYFEAVYSLEGEQVMVDKMQANASYNQLDNIYCQAVDLYKTDLLEALKRFGPTLQKSEIAAVLLDPPRSGALEIMPSLGALKPSKILYIACDPATCARDCGILMQDYGYKIKKIGIMDMFSHTTHIETMVLLEG